MKRPNCFLLGALLVPVLAPMASGQFANGLVAYWPLDGDLLDASDTGAHGTFQPGTGDPTERYGPGQFGDGINLNDFAGGSFDQFISIDQVGEETFDLSGGSMTVSVWASSPFLSIDNQTIVAKGQGTSWRLARAGATSTAAFSGGLGSSATGDETLHFIDDTLMHHIVGVVEAGVGVRLYLDGQLVGAVNGDAQIGNSDEFLAIGANPAAAGGLPWEGVIDDVAVWSRALSAGEIATLFNSGNGVSVGEALNPVDTDEDGIPDFYENTNGLDPNRDDTAEDLDGDGLTNLEEFQGGTNPQEGDTDGDGLTDGAELNEHSTDPVTADSDADGLTDGEEVTGSRNPFLDGVLRDPFDPETDPAGDPTDPNSADSDQDSFDDVTEIDFDSDPNDSESSPSTWQIGLLGYWPLDKASFDASGDDSFVDASGRGFPGKLAGTNGNPLWFGSPFYPQVVRFDGTDQRIEIQGDPDEFAQVGGDLTVSAWFVTPAWGKSWQAIVAKGEGNNWRVHRNGGNANVAYAGGRGDISGGGAVADFQWHHVVAQSENGVGTRLYVDGELVAQGNGSALSANGQPMMIAGNPDTAGDNFRTIFGAMAEVAVWGRVLSNSEVELIWLNGSGATIADLIEGADTDEDGMSDIYEEAFGLDPNDASGANGADGDPDDDGLSNLDEQSANTHPQVADTDGDGLVDGDEIDRGTDPRNPDTDGDRLTDLEEVETHGTDPTKRDTDGDTFNDPIEIRLGSDPTDANSVPDLGGALTEDLFGWWALNEGSGDVSVDLSGNGRDVALFNLDAGGLGDGGAAWAEDPDCGTVISFNGDDPTGAYGIMTNGTPGEYGALPLFTTAADNTFTWSLWVKSENGPNNDIMLGNRNRPGGGDFSPREFIKFDGNNFEFDTNNVQGVDYVDIPAGTPWTHHVIVKEGSQFTYYRDGVQAGTGTAGGSQNNPQPLFFGGQGTFAGGAGIEKWRGFMFDVRLWDRPLTADEVELLFESKGVFPGPGGGDPVPPTLQVEADGDEVVFSWNSAEGKVYRLLSADDPSSAAPADWPVFGDHQDIAATPPMNSLRMARPGDVTRLFAIEESDAP